MDGSGGVLPDPFFLFRAAVHPAEQRTIWSVVPQKRPFADRPLSPTRQRLQGHVCSWAVATLLQHLLPVHGCTSWFAGEPWERRDKR